MKILKSPVLSVCVLAVALVGCKTDPGGAAGAVPAGTFAIQVTKVEVGAATGTVASSPTGIGCGATCTSQTAFFPANSTIRLIAVATSGVFTGWTGAPCDANPRVATCDITASGGTVAVTANFGTTLPDGNVTALTGTNKLVTFDRETPNIANTSYILSGLLPGEQVLGIDYVSLNSGNTAPGPVLIGVTKIPAGSAGAPGRLIVIENGAVRNTPLSFMVDDLDPATADTISAEMSTQILSAAAADASSPFTVFSGTRYGVDYNPATATVRVVGNDGQNVNIGVFNAAAGKVTTDDALTINGAPAGATSAAYTNNFYAPGATVLYSVNPATGKLYVQNNTEGFLYEVATLTGTSISDFDIRGTGRGLDGAAIYVAVANGGNNLYSLNLTTGVSTLVSGVATPQTIPVPITDLTVNPLGEAITSIAMKPSLRHEVGDTLALTDANELISFDRAAPNLILRRNAIPRLYQYTVPGASTTPDDLVGFDINPADGEIYALSLQGRVYTINKSTGLATFKSTLSASLSGATFGVDFNPTNSRMRVVSNTGQNLVVQVDTGTVTAGPNIAGATVTASAYTNNVVGATTTVLYGINTATAATPVLVTQNLTTGALTNVGAGLGVPAGNSNGFDIADDGVAYAALSSGGVTRLHVIDLTTGVASAATNASRIGPAGADVIIGLTVN